MTWHDPPSQIGVLGQWGGPHINIIKVKVKVKVKELMGGTPPARHRAPHLGTCMSMCVSQKIELTAVGSFSHAEIDMRFLQYAPHFLIRRDVDPIAASDRHEVVAPSRLWPSGPPPVTKVGDPINKLAGPSAIFLRSQFPSEPPLSSTICIDPLLEAMLR